MKQPLVDKDSSYKILFINMIIVQQKFQKKIIKNKKIRQIEIKLLWKMYSWKTTIMATHPYHNNTGICFTGLIKLSQERDNRHCYMYLYNNFQLIKSFFDIIIISYIFYFSNLK
jgi:hypothetical protein